MLPVPVTYAYRHEGIGDVRMPPPHRQGFVVRGTSVHRAHTTKTPRAMAMIDQTGWYGSHMKWKITYRQVSAIPVIRPASNP